MLELNDVKIDATFKRIIFDAIKQNEELKNRYSESELDEKKIRIGTKELLKKYGNLEGKELIIPEKYFKIYRTLKEKRAKINQDEMRIKEKEFQIMFKKSKDEAYVNNDNFNYFRSKLKEMIALAIEIHFYELPEFKETTIRNRGVIPEENPEEFYNHYHTLRDLYNWIENPEKEKYEIRSLKGDVTLNEELEFKVYSRRWGHKDTYSVVRTTEGWNCIFFTKYVGGKNGEAILNSMVHDGISYPISLEYDFKTLWDLADNSEMSLEELQCKISEIAEWVSEVEESKPEFLR